MNVPRFLTITGCVLMAVAASGILVSRFMHPSDIRPTLYIYNWADYIDPELITQFEKENDCKIIQDTFDDNETMLAKMLAGGNGYDIVFPSSYMIPVMRKHNLLKPLDVSLLPNVEQNFDHRYDGLKHESTLKYSVPYAFGWTGLAYRSDKIDPSHVINSWDLLKHPAFNGRVSALHDIREMLGIGLRMTGCSINSTDPKEISGSLDWILKLKPYIRKLDNSMYKSALATGEFYISVGYNSDTLQILQENEGVPVKFFIPDEGSTCTWDEMVITSDKNYELAHKFINFLYDPEVAAQNAPTVASVQPNKGMWEFMSKEDKTNPLMNPSEEDLKKLELIKDLGDKIDIYNKAWDTFTSKVVK